MSRYCGGRDSTAPLEAAEHWRDNCLLSDGSIFTGKSLWTVERIEQIDEYVPHHPEEEEGSFLDKLASQLADTAPEVKQLAAELIWVMLLCPSNIGGAKKKEAIKEIWTLSEEPLPGDSPWLQDACISGIGSAGPGYNTNRWREFVFIIRIMVAFKQLTPRERTALLEDRWALTKWLEPIPECDVRQFRHMLLYLLFPDHFERIFSGADRRKIVTTFGKERPARVNAMSHLEIDKELAAIRLEQEKTYGLLDLDFYEPPLRDLWGEAKNAAWLFLWNPEYWEWESLAADRAATREGKTVTHRWSCSNRSAAVGDKAYLKRVGASPKGIVAVGNIVTAPYEARHYDEDEAANGKTRWVVDIAFSRVQDPLKKDPFLTSGDLGDITVDQQSWSPQSSGIKIKPKSAGILKKEWKRIVESVADPSPAPIAPGIEEATNLILYGPPGTGKTYQLNKLIERYTSKNRRIDRKAWLAQQLLDVRWFDAVFVALHDLGGKGKVSDIVNHEFVDVKARAMGRKKHVSATVWATLQTHAAEESRTVGYKNRTAPLVFDKSADSAWSLVGDWEEECAEQVALAKNLRQGPVEASAHRRYEFVTFHQAYSYEDFVEGIRPARDDDVEGPAFRIVPGVFQRIALKAKADPGQRYAIFIDEINRGNIAKIFGELITLIEPDKRAVYTEAGELISGMELTLPYSGDRFGAPKNLDLLGAMNTADRSIALLDTALRRRFTFRELTPDAGVISGSRGDGYVEDGEGGVINLRALLEAMNRRIRFILNRDMMLGHAYFINIRDFSGLKDVLLNQVIPLLQEYFYEDWRRIQLVFRDVGPGDARREPQIIRHETVKEREILGYDHDDYEDMIEYRVADREEITPDAIRKVYEEGD
ncbi:MAG: EVE domain-containing protein [Desulfobacterales bacterium]|nr:EVE domain-containing protein [Desulfobacterales bacterium]